MNKKLFVIPAVFLTLLFGQFSPVYANGGSSSYTSSGNNTSTYTSSGDNTTSSGGSITLTNPLAANSLTEFFMSILSILLIFAVPLIVLYIIFAGFRYVMAQGKPEEVKKASLALLYAVIGGLIILGANIILAVIQGTIDAFGV